MKDKQEQIEEMEDIISCCWNTISAAKKLYNAGYRKLPEDGVVLSREELSKKYVSRDTYDAEIKYRKVLEKRALKETAEKIFKMLISKLESNQFLSGKRIIMEVDVENLAKQFDVEIEG